MTKAKDNAEQQQQQQQQQMETINNTSDYPMPTSPMSRRGLKLNYDTTTDTKAMKTREMSREEAEGEIMLELREAQTFDDSNITISLDTSHEQSLNTIGSRSRSGDNDPSSGNLPPRLRVPLDSDVPSWIPREERRYWTEVEEPEYMSENVDNENEQTRGRKDTPRSRSKLVQWFTPSNWNLKMFQFRRKTKNNNNNNHRHTNNHDFQPSSPSPKNCSSARRSFRSRGRNVFWNSWKSHDPEDRMSVNRVAYNTAIQSITTNQNQNQSQFQPQIGQQNQENIHDTSSNRRATHHPQSNSTSGHVDSNDHFQLTSQIEQLSFAPLDGNDYRTQNIPLESLD